jgi:hypothetical protein
MQAICAGLRVSPLRWYTGDETPRFRREGGTSRLIGGDSRTVRDARTYVYVRRRPFEDPHGRVQRKIARPAWWRCGEIRAGQIPSPGALRSLYLVLGGLQPHRSKQSWIAGPSATDRPTRETGLYTLPGLAGPRLLASSLIPRPPPTNMESSFKLPRKRSGEEDPCPSDSVRAKLGFIGKYLNRQYLPPCPAGHFDCAVIPPQYICLCQQNSTPWSIPMDAPSISADQEGWPNSSVCPGW